jgi:hypothetical protein
MANNEDLIVDQLENDIRLASEIGELNTTEYHIYSDDSGRMIIHDKVNDEFSEVINSDDVIELRDLPGAKPKDTNFKVGDIVNWKTANGDIKTGMVECKRDSSDPIKKGFILVKTDNGELIQIEKDKLTLDRDMNTVFSKSRARKYLVDKNNNLIAFGWESSLGRLAKENPSYQIKSEYDINAYRNKINKAFSEFSLENQKIFTKPYRRYVILDGNGKRVTTVDITNAKGIVKKNPSYTAIKEIEYNKSQQKKYVIS